MMEAFLIWNANTFQFFIVDEVKGLGSFPLLAQVNLVTSILQNEFVKNIYQVQVPTVVVSIVMS